MPERTSYPSGTPSWVDLASPDLDASIAFYTRLFAWDAERVEDPGAGGYTLFRLRGHDVAGAWPIADEAQPPVWTTDISVDDCDAAATRITRAGGTLLVEPQDVVDAGRTAIAADATGAVFRVWQPGRHIGARIVNEPVSLSWNELNTNDGERAAAFYAEVFGWETELHDLPGGDGIYRVQTLDGRPVAGIFEMPPEWAAPAHWMAYFAVEDTDDATARAEELGGSVMARPFDTPVGRVAVLRDTHGAAFTVISGVQPTD
jgi:predicted enzyme related to lactoylglutathione lyase